MTDNELIQLFLPLIRNGLLAPPFTNVIVKQNFEQTAQGANSQPTVYFQKLSDRRYGYTGRYDTYNPTNENFDHTEIQTYETTFQVSTLVRQNPRNISFTASDLLNFVAMVLNSDTVRDAMQAQGVGLLRVIDVANPFFTDDRDQFEASPSFDFILTYNRIYAAVVPVVDYYEFDLKRV